MNERIRELAEQAGININPLIIDGEEYEYEEVDMDGYDDLKKFAELIIRECAKVCRDQPNVYALKADRDNCAIAIEEHFGVE